ncbi:pilin [Candidatus Saccharibacteria bacterium]|nr:pilin [Candidatus Saccharibacteria bacterium]
MRKLTNIIVAMVAVLGVGATFLAPAPAYAAPADCNKLSGAANIAACSACQSETGSEWVGGKCVRASGARDLNSTIQQVINIMLFIIGILSVIMIIWGGISYVLSRGDPEKVKNAKNTIIYAIVGLIVAILAFAIVQWVFSLLGS